MDEAGVYKVGSKYGVHPLQAGQEQSLWIQIQQMDGQGMAYSDHSPEHSYIGKEAL